MSIIEGWCRGGNKTGRGKEAKISARLTELKFWQNLLIIATDIGMIVSILRPYWNGLWINLTWFLDSIVFIKTVYVSINKWR
jgi:hypothetical protein